MYFSYLFAVSTSVFIGFCFAIVGLLWMLQGIFIYSLFGVFLIFGLPWIIEYTWKNKLQTKIRNKTGEDAQFIGKFVKSDSQFGGVGYLTATEKNLVFTPLNSPDVYCFKIEDITKVRIGMRYTNNFVIVNNNVMQNSKKMIEIQMSDGNSIKWQRTMSNFGLDYAFDNNLYRRLSSGLESYKVV